MKRLLTLRVGASFAVVIMLLGVFCYELFYAQTHELPSALLGEELPAFSLPVLSSSSSSSENFLKSQDLRGRVVLLNVWASWCYACRLETDMLMKIRDQYHVPVYGIAYKDTQSTAASWLKEFGNPYTLVGLDVSGDAAIDLGVYGTPETFVINSRGRIIYRHVGVITQRTWDDVILPLVRGQLHG